MNTIDQQSLRETEALCTQEQPPRCMAKCPVHVDARALCQAVAKGDFSEGRSILEKSLVFPRVVAHLCSAPCRQACKRGEVGEAIDVRALEAACLRYGDKKSAGRVFRPNKTQRVLIVGDSLTSASAAVELARKGYQITLMTERQRLTCTLDHMIPARISWADLEGDLAILTELGVNIVVGATLDRQQWQGYEAVFLGNTEGSQLDQALQETINPETLQTSVDHVFAALPRVDFSVIDQISAGKQGAISIDRFIQKVSLTASRVHEKGFDSPLFTAVEGIVPSQMVPCSEPQGYSVQEASQEATRCLQCQCLICTEGCTFLKYYKHYPKKYVREIYNNLSIVMGNHFSNTMINSCNLCGQCQVICPNGLDMGAVCKVARQTMVQTGKMPPSTHEFALLDMAFSNSEEYFLVKHQPTHDTSAYAFFPGCQMGASSPEMVSTVYQDLTSRLAGGVGLILGCCGAIADWAGQESRFAQTLTKIEQAWLQLGKPTVITACPTCYQVFSKQTTIKVVAITEILQQLGLPQGTVQTKGILAVHDACTARADQQMQDDVRALVMALGYELVELPYHKVQTPCCGYGGLTDYANAELGQQMIRQRMAQSPYDYLTYCVNCRDRFVSQGKKAWHLLELIYGTKEQQPPGISQRRYNRLTLRNQLLGEIWGEEIMKEQEEIKLDIAESVQVLLEKRLILDSDIRQVIVNGEAEGKVLVDQDKGHLITSHRLGNVTFWVAYERIDTGSYHIHNAYSHRMEIEGV